VIAAFSQELGAMAFEVTDQIDPLHEMEARGSRITVLFRRDSSANARVDSNTNWTSFATLFYEGPASIIFLPNPIQDAAHKADRRGEHDQYWTIPT
jgi:hypothetical protein